MKKYIEIALIMICLLALTACGNKKEIILVIWLAKIIACKIVQGMMLQKWNVSLLQTNSDIGW